MILAAMITFRQRDIVVFATSVGSYPVCIFGIVSNIINIVVFTKNGFTESVNVCLVALATLDLCSHMVVLGTAPLGILLSQNVQNLDFDPLSVMYLVACFLNGSLYNTACFISSFVNMERCLCFILPLRIKTLITPRRSAAAVATFFLASICSVLPAYLSMKLDWRPHATLNRSVLGLVTFRSDTSRMFDITYYITSIFHVFCFSILLASNAGLAVSLRKQAKWQRSVTSEPQTGNRNTTGSCRSRSPSSRNMRVGRMIQVVSLVLLVSYMPTIALLLMAMRIPEVGEISVDDTRTVTVWALATFVLSANSSMNILLYHRMNSRFRNTFKTLFRKGGPQVGPNRDGNARVDGARDKTKRHTETKGDVSVLGQKEICEIKVIRRRLGFRRKGKTKVGQRIECDSAMEKGKIDKIVECKGRVAGTKKEIEKQRTAKVGDTPTEVEMLKSGKTEASQTSMLSSDQHGLRWTGTGHKLATPETTVLADSSIQATTS
ncbi:hypothetical protein RRG08_011231 [Elysia crispata]|uniref:G-protein coupled receptors family 1 profile domain-containing protein n=1 Tax=Elysia crispata TaxID=231223 RepID=A0AAE1D1T8_9GAST|nr:hypothetical protein RRG08_011231 [Elysia crispata]